MTRLIKISKLLIITILFYNTSFSQSDLSYRNDYFEFDSVKQNTLLIHLKNNNFFKNNEYFSPIIEGYTLLGYHFAPTLVYYADSRFRLEGGVDVLQYHGLKNETEFSPILSAYLRLFQRFDIVMGTLRGNVKHNMIEPMYDPEFQFTRPNESGFQFLYFGNRFSADAWLDWEQFIRYGDSIPEILTAGISAEMTFVDSESWKLKMPLQFIAKHTGGQISHRSIPVQTHVNLAAGLDLSKKMSGFVENIGGFGYYLIYREATSSNFIGINSGQACYAGININVKNGFLMMGYWNAENFYAPKGSPVFQSVSYPENDEIIKCRNLLTGKIGFHRSFNSKLKFSLVAETYYDTKDNRLDYAYSMNIVFTPDFIVKKLKIN